MPGTCSADDELLHGVNALRGHSAPGRIAEVIYTATTDGSARLRYEAGGDATQMLAGRRAADEAELLASMRAQFGLS